MSPRTASNAAGLILLPVVLVGAVRFCGWLIDCLVPLVGGWLA